MHGPACIFWADLTPRSLQEKLAAAAAIKGALGEEGAPGDLLYLCHTILEVGVGLGRIVALPHRPSTSTHIC
jgi:hypothetical protein